MKCASSLVILVRPLTVSYIKTIQIQDFFNKHAIQVDYEDLFLNIHLIYISLDRPKNSIQKRSSKNFFPTGWVRWIWVNLKSGFLNHFCRGTSGVSSAADFFPIPSWGKWDTTRLRGAGLQIRLWNLLWWDSGSLPFPVTNSKSTWKSMGWKMKWRLLGILFSGAFAVSFREWSSQVFFGRFSSKDLWWNHFPVAWAPNGPTPFWKSEMDSSGNFWRHKSWWVSWIFRQSS